MRTRTFFRVSPTRRAGAVASALLAFSAACAAPPAAYPPGALTGGAAGTVAFVGANVIPMDRERVLENHTVLVRDGRIAAVGPAASVSAPAGATVVDARGKYLIPGLAEMHAHIPTPQQGMDAVDRTLFLYLAGGVTTIRGMLGHPLHVGLRDRAARHEILSPRIYTSGPSFSRSASTPEIATQMVEEQKASGYDLLKIQPGVPRAAFDAMAATATRTGIRFAGHVPADVGLDRALQARYASIDHLDGYLEALAGHGDRFSQQESGFFGFGMIDRVDESRIPALAAATRAAGVWNAPTQTLMEHLASAEDPEAMARRPEMRFMPAATVAQWVDRKRSFQADPAFTPARAQRFLQVRRRLIKALHDAGAGLVLGSDAPQWWNVPGFSARRELEYMVEAGLTPFQALETGTRNAAMYFGAQGQWGTVEVGRSADLLLLEANPLQDVRNLWRQAGVMARGQWLPQAEIDRRLNEIAAQVR
ncbi:MAG: amidohydrolase family protein [Gemmatimonadetes bacterium]|nr:amidohydrolase family protein [Gemmatimonadota bacterium]